MTRLLESVVLALLLMVSITYLANRIGPTSDICYMWDGSAVNCPVASNYSGSPADPFD